MNYGLPYQGSKNTIADLIVSWLPPSHTLVDLFAGGCAVTHCAMRRRKYQRFIVNDISPIPSLFVSAANGEYRNERRWISKEDFDRLKDTDLFVKYCWSFGNKGTSYMYSKTIEPYKKACHYAVVFNDWSLFDKLCPEVSDAVKNAIKTAKDTKTRRVEFGRAVVRELKRLGNPSLVESNPLYKSCHRKKDASMQSLQSLQSLERLERLQSLESLERLQRLQSLQSDYRDVEIPEGSTVYCDIPYYNTGSEYVKGFNHSEFYDWCDNRNFPVFVSEYWMPEERFLKIARVTKQVNASAKTSSKGDEGLFVQKRFADDFKRLLFV